MEILRYEKKNDKLYPVIECEERKDFPGGLQFFCAFCRKIHHHGKGNGHRVEHCDKDDSPFEEHGYILEMKK